MLIYKNIIYKIIYDDNNKVTKNTMNNIYIM